MTHDSLKYELQVISDSIKSIVNSTRSVKHLIRRLEKKIALSPDTDDAFIDEVIQVKRKLLDHEEELANCHRNKMILKAECDNVKLKRTLNFAERKCDEFMKEVYRLHDVEDGLNYKINEIKLAHDKEIICLKVAATLCDVCNPCVHQHEPCKC